MISDLILFLRNNPTAKVLGSFNTAASVGAAVGSTKNEAPAFANRLCEVSLGEFNRQKVFVFKVVGERKQIKLSTSRLQDDQIALSYVNGVVFNSDLLKQPEVAPEATPTALSSIHMIWCVDCSGSMCYLATPFSKGINEKATSILRDNEGSGVDIDISILEFDNKIFPIKFKHFSSKKENNFTYQLVPRGMTALNDAIQTALRYAQKYLNERSDRVLIEVFTDGEENASSISLNKLKKEIAETLKDNRILLAITGPKDNGKFESYAHALGIDPSNVLSIETTVKGIENYAKVSTTATLNYTEVTRSGEFVTTNFYMDKE